MPTKVVHIREPYDVYIGRSGKGVPGPFGNPYKVGEPCPRCGSTHMTGGSTLPCFKAYFYARLASDEAFRAAVEALRGKTLGCFCKPHPCHGDVIVEYLEGNPLNAMDELTGD